MQNNEQKVSPDGDRCAKAVTDVSMQQVTPAQIKNAAAALANLMRSHEGSGSKMRPSALSTFLSLPKPAVVDASQSDDESEDVESVGEEDVDKSRFLLSSKSLRSTESGHLDPETRARLRALLESTGLGKLSTADSKALADPEVLRRLTDKVNSAMDEAASTLMRIKAEQQKGSGSAPASGNTGACAASSSSDIDVVHLTLEDGQLCPAELEQALEGDSLLLMACSAGYYQLAEALLALKSDVEDRGTKGDRTPLMEAACGGYLDIVRLLIAHKADVNAQAPSGNTALHYAACSGYVDVARELLIAGARVEEPNENGHTPLMEAATAGQVEIAALLLANGANINTHSTEFKESALTLACYKGHLEMVKFLLEKGADLEHKTDEMHTALMEASMDGHVDVARLLLDRGAQVNMPADSFESPLTLAACGGHTELASLLIERGANLEEVNDEGYTPLMEAVREGHEDMVTLLIHRGADVNAQTEETQETALTLACCGGFLEIAELLVNSGANLELGCSTPLMEAAQEGHVELVKYLIGAGAQVNAQTFTKGTALTYACENGHTEVAEILVQHGADIDHESEGGRTALMRAAKNGHLRTAEFLVSKGACVNKVTTNNDHTVLSVACANGHLHVVEFLLCAGADFTHKLKDGSTMLIEAAKGGHCDIMNLLLDWPTSGAKAAAAGGAAGFEAAVQLNKLSHDASAAAVTGGAGDTAAKAATAAARRNMMAIRDEPDGVMVQAISGAAEGGSAAAQIVGAGTVAAEPATPDDGSWEAFVGKMATKGELLGLDREEQIVVKQQMLDRLMQLERELQERTMQSGKASVSAEDVSKMHAEDVAAAAATRNRFVVVDDHLRGDEELAIAILEKAVLGETVLDRVVLEQLKAYIRGSGGDAALLEGAVATAEGSQSPGSSRAPSGDGSGDFVRDLDNSSVSSSSSEEGEKFEDAYGDEGGPEAAAGAADSSTEVTPATILPQLDRVEKHVSPPVRRTFEQTVKETMNAGQLPRSPADGGDVVTHTPQPAKAKDRAKVQRRLAKPQSTTAGAVSPAPASVVTKVAATAQQQSEVERNATLQQQRQQLQAQLALQQQLHDELQQHLKLQQEHQQLQAQLKVKEAVQSPANDGVTQGKATGPLLLPPDHQCCHHQHPCPQQRQHVQQQLRQLQHQLQQAAGQTNIDSLQQAQQQAKHLALLHQKHSSLAAASTITQSTQTSSAPAAVPSVTDAAPAAVQLQQQQQQQQQPTGTKSIHIPLTGNAAALAAQKKAADLAAQANRQRQPAGSNQNRTGVAAPCPNCCVDAAKQHAAAATACTTARPPAPGAATAPIDVNAETDSNHDTALTLAAAGGHARLVTLLLSRGANVEHRDKKGLSPLILAAAAGHVEVCEVLITHKAEVDGVSDKNKDTALSLACSNGRLEVVELLLSKGANKEHRNISDYTPLSQAASGGYVNVIKVLLAHGAEINSRTGSKMGISPLMLAAMNGHTAAVKLLLDMGSDINAQIETNRNTALTLACFQGRYEVVSLLIDRKANIEHRAKTGLTPLMEAASGGYVEVGRVLLDKGADIAAAPVPVSRDTALTIAADKGHHRFVELLLSRGAAVDVKNKKGNTPLWLACNGGHVEVVQLLVAAGADVHSEDHRRVSCIMAAFRKAHIKVVKVLVRHVTQFPPDQDCLRYIATLTDKEMVKRCHQCMTLIVTAKEQQAAEANKNAAILLEELSLEREREETKRAAAARKRDRKKLKKKEKADRDRDLPDETLGSLDNGDGDGDDADGTGDDAPSTFEKRPSALDNGLLDEREIMLSSASNLSSSSGNSANARDLLPADVATNNAKNDVPAAAPVASSRGTSGTSTQDGQRRNRRNRRERQKNDGNGNNPDDKTPVQPSDGAVKSSSVPAAFNGDPQPIVTPASNAAAAYCMPPAAMSFSSASTAVKVKPTAVVTGAPAVINRDAHRDVFVEPPMKPTIIPLMSIQPTSLTGIGDLDDFGSLSISSAAQMRSSSMKKPTATEKPRITLVEQKGPLPVKRGTVTQSRSNTKKGQRRDEDWEEVSRKSKRLLVPANAISRVIGRGGCNINAIRDISTAQVEIDRSKDSTTERIITIKGSVEATRYAQTLIEALVNDTEKKFEQQLSKMKPLQTTSGSGQKQKSAVAAAMMKSAMNGGAAAATKDDPMKAKRPVVPLSSFTISAWGQPPQSRSGNLATGSSGTATVATAWNGADSQARASPDMVNMSYSDRAKFAATSAGMSVAVTAASQDGAMQSWSPVNERMPDSSPVTPSASTVMPQLSTPVRSEPQPLPIVTSAGYPNVSTARFNAAPPTAGVMRDYSPFNNVLSQIAESVLAKRPDDFASVAAAGIVMNASPPLPNQYPEDSQMQQGSGLGSDPHKAPGYKPPACTDPSKAPGHRAGAQTARNAMISSESAGVFRQQEYIGRPSSTPTAVAHSPLIGDEMENSGPRGRALGASLDRPASFYGVTNFMSGVPVNFSQPPPGLLQFGSSCGPNQDTFAPPLMHQFGGGSHGGLASAVSETSVLAAPLMATSVASVSQPGYIGSQLVMPTPASAPSTAGYACLPENSYADVTNQSPVMASEPGIGAAGMMEDRKTLGPIGTERAARRPPQPVVPTPSYQQSFGLPHSEPPPSMWPFNADAGWNQLPQMFGATLADQSAMLAAAGFHMDDTLLRSHQSGLHMGYQPHGLGDMNAATAAMMMSDMYPVDPSLAIDHATMQQMLHAQNQQAMMMPSMFAGADMSASYGGMVGGQAPATGYPSLGNTAGYMMNSEDPSSAWSTSATAPDFQQHYLGPKGPQMMWNQSSWTPSANM